MDRYVPNLAACLKDKDKLVRKQTLTQLTQLVLVKKIEIKILFRPKILLNGHF